MPHKPFVGAIVRLVRLNTVNRFWILFQVKNQRYLEAIAAAPTENK